MKWFGGTEDVSRAFFTGLGADGNLSYITFGAGKILGNSDIYGWRSEAANTLMQGGFDSFKDLFNYGASSPSGWDINQLQSEQKGLQPVHGKYLENYWIFRKVGEVFTFPSVDLLEYDSRINYGCKKMGYKESDGCLP